MTDSDRKRTRIRDLRRAGLRAFNGAMLGVLLGGLLGAALGAAFAGLVGHGTDACTLGAAFGVPPGLFAGALIGTTMVVRRPGRGFTAGILTGAAVGALYAFLLLPLGGLSAITASILASGFIGGLVLSLLLRWIRRRWRWWTRWETA